MKFAPLLRSSGIALGLLTAAIVSCTNGSSDDTPIGLAAAPGSGGSGAGTSATGGSVASGGTTTSTGATTAMGGTSACANAASFQITDLENPAQWNAWSTTNDATAGAMQTPTGAFMAEMSTADLHYSAHTTGTGFTNWGAGLALNLATAKTCYDFSKFTGFKFKGKGPANLTVAAQTTGVLPAPAGTCTGTCYDSHKTTVTLGADFADYTVYFNQLAQGGWGQSVAFNPKDLVTFIFEVGPADMPFNYWLDNISFIDTPPPGSGAGGSGAGGTTSAGGSTSGGATGAGGSVVIPVHKFTDLLSEAQFNQIFPNKGPFYTYANLVAATNRFTSFGAVGDATAQKQEVAAFLANVGLESGGLDFTDEQNPPSIYCDSTNTMYPCASGQDYHGRGPLQLSWNYNYGAAGVALAQPLLQNPALVATDGLITWQAAVWYWMDSISGGKTAHSAMIQGLGFGATIQVINGAVECGGKAPSRVQQRVQWYQNICNILGIPTGNNLSC